MLTLSKRALRQVTGGMWVKEPEEPRRETYSCRFQHGDGNQKEKETGRMGPTRRNGARQPNQNIMLGVM